jgi:predicted 3-demethylubiquinone-9 3-methyltransferase (glyoxalase superfamily)
MQKINPFLWFDDNAEESVNFYTSVFDNSKIKTTTRYGEASANAAGRPKDSVMTVAFDLFGQPFMAINGGPMFKFTSAVSFFVNCETEGEINKLWGNLSKDGIVRMPLDKYPFGSEKYGWTQDKFGLSWQLALTKKQQSITPFLWFGSDAENAIQFYTTVFKNSSIKNVVRFGANDRGPEGEIMHAAFTLNGQEFMAMDTNKESFNEAQSFVVNCDNQKELDYYWDKLSAVPQAEMCGWLKDKYGLSWQIVPTAIGDLLSSKESGKSQRVMQKVLQMKKLDIAELENA